MLCVIPKKYKVNRRDVTHNKDNFYHYELESVSKFVVIYKCLENGTKECFQKKDFFKYNKIVED